MNDLRERKMQERAHRIALRIHAERKSGVAAHYPSADAMCAPIAGGQWKVPEPSKAAMEHMASFGFVEPEPANTPISQPTEPANTPISQPEPQTLSQAIERGVTTALAMVGWPRWVDPRVRAAMTRAESNPPPRNEDK